MLGILAQISDSTNYLQIASTLGGTGFAVWFAWYASTRIIPEMNKENSETHKKIVEDFREEMREQRAMEMTRMQRSHELAREGMDAVARLNQSITALLSDSKG